MPPQDIQHKADEVAALLFEKLSLRVKTLDVQLTRSAAVFPCLVLKKVNFSQCRGGGRVSATDNSDQSGGGVARALRFVSI
jgi:hypothetical protein